MDNDGRAPGTSTYMQRDADDDQRLEIAKRAAAGDEDGEPLDDGNNESTMFEKKDKSFECKFKLEYNFDHLSFLILE